MAPNNNKITPAKTNKEKGAGRDAVNDAVDGVIAKERKTIVHLNKAKCYDKIQRKVEPNCFSVGVINLSGETVCTLMNCKDPFNPKSKTEAKAIADGCQYVGAKIPGVVMDMLDTTPVLTPKYVYCNLPFFDKKGECLTYGAKRDRAFDLQYDRAAKKVKGGVSNSRDVYESKALAEDGGSTLATRIDLDPTENEMNQTIRKLRVENYGYERLCVHLMNGLGIAIGEVTKFRDALADAHLDCPDQVKMKEIDPLYKKVCDAYEKDNWKELGKALATRFASKVPSDVPGDIDADSVEESVPGSL